MKSPRPASFEPFPFSEVDQTIASRFEFQAARRPEAEAFCNTVGRWSFGDLNRAANRLAALVKGSAGGPGKFIALLLEPASLVSVAGILAVYKAGCVAVPLDPAQPVERLRLALSLVGSRLILADASSRDIAEAAIEGLDAALVLADPGAPGPENDPSPLGRPEGPALVTLTSGSTGRPKGVLQSHRALLHGTAAQTDELAISPTDRGLHSSSIAFGSAAGEVFPLLLNGACVCAYPLAREGPAGVAEFLRRERVSIYHSVPAVFREVVRSLPESSALPDLRLVRLSGDAILPSDAALWRRHFSPSSLLRVNFALTEAGSVCSRLLDFDTPVFPGPLPVGWPSPGFDVTIRDDEGRRVADGETGEICVASAHLAIGYHGDPELTARKFVADPDTVGGRMFRTGDLGRWNPRDGLEHRGRQDFQVKVRGMRVDLTEVEAELSAASGQPDVAVVARSDEGETRLVAYVAGPDAPRRRALRTALRGRLPESFVPSAFVFLDTLPRTANGKLDRRSLPAPRPSDYSSEGDCVPPRNATESALLEIWRRSLPGEVGGVTDSFFDCGGDSLAAAEMLAAIETKFGRSLALPIFVESPTIESLAARLQSAPDAGGSEPIVALRATGSRRPFFCIPGGNGPGFNLRTIANLLGDDQPFYAFHVATEIGRPIPASIEAWAEDFLSHVRSVQPEGPYRIGGHSLGGTIAFEMARRLTERGERVEFLALLDTFAPGYPRPLSRPEKFVERWADFLGRPAGEKLRTVRRTLGRGWRRLARASEPPPATTRPSFGDGTFGQVIRQYVHRPLGVPLVLFAARERERWRGFSFDDPENGWRPLAGDRLSVFPVDGNHDSLLEGRGAERIAEVLDPLLAQRR